MSTLSLDDSRDPRSHRYYAPRDRRVAAREATLQPVLERLRGGTRDYSADERLSSDADPVSLSETAFVLVPERRFPFAALAAFAGGATAVAALAFAYLAFDANGAPVAAAAPSAPPAAQAPAAAAKIDARLTPNQPVTGVHAAQAVQAQVASAVATNATPVDVSKGDRLDASANSGAGVSYNPLQSPLSLWSMTPTQLAIEGTDPALAARDAPPLAAEPAAAPPQQTAPERDATPVRHHARHVRHVRHLRHHKPATTGAAASAAGARNAAAAKAGAEAQPAATRKFLGIFGG